MFVLRVIKKLQKKLKALVEHVKNRNRHAPSPQPCFLFPRSH